MSQLGEHKSHDDLWLLVDGKGKRDIETKMGKMSHSIPRRFSFQHLLFILTQLFLHASISLLHSVYDVSKFMDEVSLLPLSYQTHLPSFRTFSIFNPSLSPSLLSLSDFLPSFPTPSISLLFYIPQHPGGDEVLLSEGGKDATEAFEDVGHSDDARALLPKMLVGEIEGGVSTFKTRLRDVEYYSGASGLSIEVKERVE